MAGPATAAVAEDATSVVLTVNRTGSSAGAVTVDYAFTSLTATNGVDFDGTNASLSFGDGVTSLTVTVPITNDTDIENAETFTLSLTNLTGAAAILGAYDSLTATIRDNDSIFNVLTNAMSVSEGAATTTFTIRRTGGVAAAATIRYASTNDSATAGADYNAAAGVVTFAAGETNKTVTLTIRNDTTVETNEAFTVGLHTPTAEGALGTNTVVTVTIVDNDFSIGDIDVGIAEVRIVSLRWTSDGLPLITANGPLGSHVIIDASTDLVNWEQLIAENIVAGAVETTDPAAIDQSKRFYRLRAPAPEAEGQ